MLGDQAEQHLPWSQSFPYNANMIIKWFWKSKKVRSRSVKDKKSMVFSSSKKPFYQRQAGNFVFVVRPVVMIKVAIGGGENDMPCRVAGGASKS